MLVGKYLLVLHDVIEQFPGQTPVSACTNTTQTTGVCQQRVPSIHIADEYVPIQVRAGGGK